MDDEAPPYNPAAGDLHPALAQIPADEQHQPWAADAISRIQDHLASTAIVDQAEAAGHQFVNDVAQTKQNMLGMVRTDPTATPLALDLVDGFPLGDELKDHFRNEIAKTSVQAYAGISQQAGHDAIDRLGEHLDDGETAALRGYVDNMQRLREADARSTMIQQAKQMVAGSNQAALAHVGQLVSPNGDVQFPPGWGQRMMADLSLAPEAKASLYRGYSALQQNGDPERSDPALVASIVNRLAQGYQNPDHPTPPEILGHLGDRLTVADARWLSSLSGPQPTAVKDGLQLAATAMSQAEAQIGNPRAYGRFLDWFLPRVQAGAVLDRNSQDYLMTPERMAQFRPTGDDLLAPITAGVDKQQRPSLGQIFGGR